jgi:DNA polymerase elongation subunit (family B)
MYRNLFYNYTDEEMILYTWDAQGNRVTERHTYHPYYYVDTSGEPDAYSIFGSPLKKRVFRKQFDRLRSIKDGGATRIYHNLPCDQQFLIDHFGLQNATPDFMKFLLRVYFLDIEVHSRGGFPTPKEAKDKINLITFYDTQSKMFYSWGLEKDYVPDRPDVLYVKCATEAELLEKFLQHWEKNYPDVFSGWNTEFFDIPYIINRIKRVLGEEHANRLSPVGRIFEKQFMGPFGKPSTKWVIYGMSCLDYMELYKKFTMEKRESYKLDAIAEIEVGMNKVKYKYSNLATLADEDWQEFVKYNIVDVDLLVHLDTKLNYIQLTRKLAYTGLTPLEAALGTLSVVTGCIALKALEEHEHVIPTFEDEIEGEIEGGYVREPIRGLHDAIVSFDANSLYPNTMITLNLSPETKLGKIVEKTDNEVRILGVSGKEYTLSTEKFIHFIKNEVVAISRAGVMFTQKKKGLVPQIIEKLYNERVGIKKELKESKKAQSAFKKDTPEYKEWQTKVDQFNVRQHTIKILINSMYGYWANKFSPLGDTDLARSITLTGQAVAKEAAAISERFVKEVHKVDTKDPIVIAGDTDSIYISVNPVMKANNWAVAKDGKVTPEMYKVCNDLEEYLSTNITAWAKRALNTIDPRFVFKRETVCDTALFIEKKRYVAHVLDDEGLQTDKFKYVGVSVVTTSVPKKLKPFIKTVAENMLRTKSLNETNKVYAKVYEDYKALNVEDIATTRGISDYDSYANECDGLRVVKGMPVHVKSAYYYNMMLDQFNIADKYEKVASGDKIKWYYCLPNRFKIETMAYKEYLPAEIKECFPIDTETMFEKVIGSAVNILYTAANWPVSTPNNQQTTNLLDLFS